MINVTMVAPPASGNVVCYPGDQSPPTASIVNFVPELNRTNNAIVKLGADGTIACRAILVNGGSVHAVIDVTAGYFD